MNCPRCGKEMKIDGKFSVVKGILGDYDFKRYEWKLPEKVIMEFEKTYVCHEETCNRRDKYTFIDGNYNYILEK